MPLVDSVDKIVISYFRSVTEVSFSYKGKIYNPIPLTVSPLILRGFTCPEMCGGCCPRFSLDYLPSEKRPPYIETLRNILFNEENISIYSDLQDDHKDHFCRNLDKDNGRCNIYSERPFSCDFELIRFFVSEDKSRVSQQLFGRGWQFLRIDSERGARCTMTPPTEDTIQETIRKLNRLEQWASYFRIITKVPRIIDWIFSGDTTKHLRIE